MTAVAETRKYVLTRITTGDYMFPSNDGQRLWRIYTYQEDGSLERNGKEVRGTFWAAARFIGTLADAEALMRSDPDEFLSWTPWEFWSGPWRKRADAVDSAVRA